MNRITYDEAFERVSACTELATFSRSYAEISHLARDGSSNSKKLATVISKDPALAAKILKTVNSCFYALTREIGTIEDAVVVLGFGEVERLSLAISVINKFSAQRRHAGDLNQLWRHCLVCGVAAEALVEAYQLKKFSANDVYMGALLHDLGKGVILQVFPELVPEIRGVMERGGLSAFLAENEVLSGANHCVAGAWTCGNWGLPMDIVQSIQMHHTPQEVQGDDVLVKLIYMADAACYYYSVPATVLSEGIAQPGPQSCAFLKDNAVFGECFKKRWESKKAAIEAITGA
jgi:putative nucleotidyltransferase with HDIG domain